MSDFIENSGKVDMSSEAIARRLRDLQQLYLFSMSLRRATFVDEPRNAEQFDERRPREADD